MQLVMNPPYLSYSPFPLLPLPPYRATGSLLSQENLFTTVAALQHRKFTQTSHFTIIYYMVAFTYESNIIYTWSLSLSAHTHSPGDGIMKSSIPVLVERPSRHAATVLVSGPLQIQSVGVASKLETSGGFSRNRRTLHPHTGGAAARRRQQELTSSATHEMHLHPREVRGKSLVAVNFIH